MAAKRRTTRKKPTLVDLFPEHRKLAYLKKATEAREECVNRLADAHRHRGLVLYVGAGVPISVGLPSWTDLVRSLTVRMMTSKVDSAIEALGKTTEEARWQLFDEFYEYLWAELPAEKPKLMMARSIKDQFGTKLPKEIARILYRRILRQGKQAIQNVEPPSYSRLLRSSRNHPLLDAVAAIARAERDAKGVQAIVNYNYDDVLEAYLTEQRIKCKIVLSGADKVPDGVLPSYHVHGLVRLEDSVRRPTRATESTGNFVFSEDEYHAEYADPYRWSNMTQMSHLGRYTGLFIGLSMEDPNIRRLIDVTHRQYPDIRNFAILARKQSLARSKDDRRTLLRNLFEDVETQSFAKIGVNIIWVDHHQDIPTTLTRIVQ